MDDITEVLDEMHAAVVSMLPPTLLDLTDINATRAGLDGLLAALPSPPLPGDVTLSDHHAPGRDGDPDVLVRIYQPANAQPDGPALYWIHGGGMVLMSVDSDDLKCAMWARELGVVIASVDYRLAPEAPYPAPIHDCHAGLAWFAEHAAQFGVDAERIVIGGASAGGGLAAGTALFARDHGGPHLAGQMLVFPMLDDRNETPSSRSINDSRVWNHSANVLAWAAYLGGANGDAPIYAAPSRCDDLSGLPPAFLNVGAHDIFLDEDLAYARALMAAGVPTELKVYPYAFHGSNSFVADHPISQQWVADEMTALRRLLGTADITA